MSESDEVSESNSSDSDLSQSSLRDNNWNHSDLADGSSSDDSEDYDDVWPTYQSVPTESLPAPAIEPTLAMEIETEPSTSDSAEANLTDIETAEDEGVASDEVPSSNAWSNETWSNTEFPKDAVGDPSDHSEINPDAQSLTSGLWPADSQPLDYESSAMASEPADASDAYSVVEGSLANSLIADLASDREFETAANIDRELHDAADSDQPEVTHEGTFVLSENPEEADWATHKESFGSHDDEPAEPAATETAADWEDVSDQSHDFLGVDDEELEIEDDQSLETSFADSLESPMDATAAMESEAAEDDDSIEAYMNRLLRRVQGGDGTPEPVQAPPPQSMSVSTSQSSLFSKSTNSMNVSRETSITQSQPIDADAPLVPRSHAPERAGNLSAMRELANSSTRSAISQSARVQSRDTQIQAMVSFACAIGALACNALAFYFLSGVLLIVAVAMTFVVAFICFREGTNLLREARRRVEAAESTGKTLAANLPPAAGKLTD